MEKKKIIRKKSGYSYDTDRWSSFDIAGSLHSCYRIEGTNETKSKK